MWMKYVAPTGPNIDIGGYGSRLKAGTTAGLWRLRTQTRHCESTGRANARPMTGFAKQSIAPRNKKK